MKTFNAIIIDDEPYAIALLQLCLKDLCPFVHVTKTCTDWTSALQALREGIYDLVFLDVMMPGRTGIELARLLTDIRGHIIFVTAHEDYALEAFRCHAAGYLLKPVDELELNELMSRILKPNVHVDHIPEDIKKSSMLGIPGVRGIDYIDMNDIIYLQADHKCTKVVLINGVYYSSYNLGKFREFLKEDSFFQVHRSYIIRLSAVKRYLACHTAVVMKDNTEIPVARAVKETLLKQFKTLARLSD